MKIKLRITVDLAVDTQEQADSLRDHITRAIVGTVGEDAIEVGQAILFATHLPRPGPGKPGEQRGPLSV